MNRDYAPSETLELIERLPVSALLKIEHKVFTNRRFQELTGFCQESPSIFEECMQLLFGERRQEMVELFELDSHRPSRLPRITNIRTQNGGERWVEWRSLQNNQENILLLWDITHLWRTRTDLEKRSSTLEEKLSQRTEDLEKAVNLLLAHHQQILYYEETNQLLADILSVNQQLLKLLTSHLPAPAAPVQRILEQCSASLQTLENCCLHPEADNHLRPHLQAMEKLLLMTTRKGGTE